MSALKGVELRVPPLELKENSELECWRDFILRFEIALINTNLSITGSNTATATTKVKIGESSGDAEAKAQAKAEAEAVIADMDSRRGGLLLNTIGPEGYRIFTKWNILAKDILYSDLRRRFEEKFTGRQNLFITRHRFLTMEQMSTEKVEVFIDRIAKAATFCRFDTLEDDLVLQIATKGLRNDKLRKELLAADDLTIQKARNICHLFTSAEESNNFLNDKTEVAVAAVESRSSTKIDSRRSNNNECFICKSKNHWSKDCPKKKWRETKSEVTCYQCGLKGHIARFCTNRKKSVREVKAEKMYKEREPESDESF